MKQHIAGSEVQTKGKLAKFSSYLMNLKTTEEKNEALAKIAEQLLLEKEAIIEANKKDLENGKKQGLSDAILDRIMLNEQRIQAMVDAIHQLIELPDPVGEVLESFTKENGLQIEKDVYRSV